MQSNIYLPEWLTPLLGQREKAIITAPDVKVMQCLPECWDEAENRLPVHQQHIVSLSLGAYFTICATRRAIIG